MDNNLHCPDLSAFDFRSLFNEEGGKGEQTRGKGKKEQKAQFWINMHTLHLFVNDLRVH